jgi:hypothetical protein
VWREAPDWGTIWGIQSWYKGDLAAKHSVLNEEPEEGRATAVVEASRSSSSSTDGEQGRRRRLLI